MNLGGHGRAQCHCPEAELSLGLFDVRLQNLRELLGCVVAGSLSVAHSTPSHTHTPSGNFHLRTMNRAPSIPAKAVLRTHPPTTPPSPRMACPTSDQLFISSNKDCHIQQWLLSNILIYQLMLVGVLYSFPKGKCKSIACKENEDDR